MKESLKRIESGKFAKDWLEEAAKGAPNPVSYTHL